MQYKHIEGVKVKAVFSDCKKYRYRLDIDLKDAPPKGKTACVIMMNPSYANEEIADKSVQFMQRIVLQRGLAEFKGVKRLTVVNQFAFIQTHKFQGLPHEVGPLNDLTIKKVFRESEIIIVGWGCANPFEERKNFVYGLLKDMKGKKLLKTRKHPSRAGYEGFILPFDFPEDQ